MEGKFAIRDKFMYTFLVAGYAGKEKSVLMEVFEIVITEEGHCYSLRSKCVAPSFIQEYVKETQLTKENGYLPVLGWQMIEEDNCKHPVCAFCGHCNKKQKETEL